jgi:hypothetical protein
MSDTEYTEFTHAYLVLFPVTGTGKDVREMLVFWSRSIQEFGFPEAMTALEEVSGDPSMKQSWRANHLGMLKASVMKNRHARQRAEREELDRRYQATACRDCGGVGTVSVPHPHCIVDGDWIYPYYEVCVFCSCIRGQLRRQSCEPHLAAKHLRLTAYGSIGEYENMYPEWQAIVQDRKEKRAAEQAGTEYARIADKNAPVDPKRFPKALENLKRAIGNG